MTVYAATFTAEVRRQPTLASVARDDPRALPRYVLRTEPLCIACSGAYRDRDRSHRLGSRAGARGCSGSYANCALRTLSPASYFRAWSPPLDGRGLRMADYGRDDRVRTRLGSVLREVRKRICVPSLGPCCRPVLKVLSGHILPESCPPSRTNTSRSFRPSPKSVPLSACMPRTNYS